MLGSGRPPARSAAVVAAARASTSATLNSRVASSSVERTTR